MVYTLANDSSDVASIILARSPVLSDAELVDCAATADGFAQSAIAHRPWVPAPVCAALAEAGALESLIALASNPGAASISKLLAQDPLVERMTRIVQKHKPGRVIHGN
jgi:uncharacterized protein (DUF2336 family)